MNRHSFIPAAYAGSGLQLPPDAGLPTTELPTLIVNIVNAALVLVGVLALAFLVYGGFLYITSRGDRDQVEQAKHVLVYAVIGIIVVGLAAALVNFVIGGLIGGGDGGGINR